MNRSAKVFLSSFFCFISLSFSFASALDLSFLLRLLFFFILRLETKKFTLSALLHCTNKKEEKKISLFLFSLSSLFSLFSPSLFFHFAALPLGQNHATSTPAIATLAPTASPASGLLPSASQPQR